MKTFKLFALLAFVMSTGTADAAKAKFNTKPALQAAEAWLKLIDQGKYDDSWKKSAEFFRANVAQDSWKQMLESLRTPFGKMKSRNVIGEDYMTTVPGAPDGQYVRIQFESAFENKAKAVETVTPMKDKDGSWRVSGYYIK